MKKLLEINIVKTILSIVFIPSMLSAIGFSSLIPILFYFSSPIITLLVLLVTFTLSDIGSTVVFAGGFIIMINVFRMDFFFKYFNIRNYSLLFIGLFIALQLIYTYFYQFYELNRDDAYTVFDFLGDDKDTNGIWRVMFWAYTIKIHNLSSIPKLLFGIGFGTPLYDTKNQAGFINIVENDYQEFLIGPHNSYVLIFLRLGLIGFSLFSIIFFEVFTISKKFSTKRNFQKKYIIGFYVMCIGAFFNVVLESSIYSGLFWIILGLVSRCNNEECHKKYSS